MSRFKPVDVAIRWADLFKKEMPANLRRQRWEKWKEVASSHDEQGREMVDYWSKDNVDESCAGCIHRDKDWCKLQDLPCNVNPVLTIQHNMIGMACMGTGYQSKPEQLELFK